jgi:hypothetical protein
MTAVGQSVIVWTGKHGVPERFVWEGKRFRVSDTPTPLDFEIGLLTHMPSVPTGWRLQGTDESGDSLVFDIGRFADDRDWRILHTYR